jgi:hypothetical protein
MDTNILASLGEAAQLFASGAFLTNLLMSGYTRANPGRTSAHAFTVSMLVGVCMVLLWALASALPLTIQTAAQVVIVGLLAGAGAGGSQALSKKAEAAKATARERKTRRITDKPIGQSRI